MENISNQIRAKLKRLCPYAGPYIPNSVRQNARHIWTAPYDPGKDAGWWWDEDQWALLLCNIDAHTIDPAGYVAIRPLEQDQYALIFVLGIKWAEGFGSINLIFDTTQEAKYYLDTLLAADTPEIRSQ